MRLQDFKALLRAHRLLVALAAAGLLAAAWFLPPLLAGPEIATLSVVRRDFAQTVVASGHVEAPHRATIAALLAGKVLRVPVREGQAVVAGQVLVELDGAEWAASVAQAEATVAQAEARLRQLDEVDAPVATQALREAEITLKNARQQRERSAALVRQGFIGVAAMDDADKAVALAQAQEAAARAQQRGSTAAGADTRIAAAALAQARSALAMARSHLANARIVAPVAGTLIARNVEPGDIVQPGALLMTLSPDGATQLVVDIDERNMRLLQVGLPARASADAFADQVFEARLAYVNPGVDLQRGTVEVKLDVPAPPAWLRQDMTVSVDIQVATRTRALLVPLDAVRDARGARPWVLVVEGGRVHRRALRLGIVGTGFAEVLDGVGEGALVAAGSASVADGTRVRTARAPG